MTGITNELVAIMISIGFHPDRKLLCYDENMRSIEMKSDYIEPGLLQTFRLFVQIEAAVLVLIAVLGPIEGGDIFPSTGLIISLIDVVVLYLFITIPFFRISLKRYFLPIGLVIATAIPIINTYFNIIQLQQNNPLLLLRSTWAMLPILLVPLILIAWQYTFHEVVYFCIFSSVAQVLVVLSVSDRLITTYYAIIGMEVGKSITFLMIGYLVSRVMVTQRQQRRELMESNAKLEQHASTLEQLTVSRERNRLARELHDILAHTLSGLIIQLEAIKALKDKKPEDAEATLDQALEIARSGLTETRRALKDLRATQLDDLGLKLALENLARTYILKTGIPIDFSIQNSAEPLTPQVEQAIYRIAQEALENASRHSHASRIRFIFHREGGGIEMRVQDNGRGFDFNKLPQVERLGIRGMIERSVAIGGNVDLESHPGEGAEVIFRMGSSHD
jgi:signal transduction histidine kinase